MTVTIDFRDLQAAVADATGQLVFGDGLSAATVRRLACDAKIIPLVLGTNSEPLDVGRSERLVTRAIRRALNARDNGCVVCNAPPVMCDAHHLKSWIDGGETKVDNLVLICRRHHVDLHAGHWTITITNGIVHVARPTWAEPPTHRKRSQPDQPAAWSTNTTPPTAPPRARTGSPAPTSPPARQTTPDELGPTPPTPDQPWSGKPAPSEPGSGTPTPDGPWSGKAALCEPGSGMPTSDRPWSGKAVLCEPGSGTPTLDEPVPSIPTSNEAWSGMRSGGQSPPGVSAAPDCSGSAASESVVSITRRSRWKADEAELREAAEFAILDVPAS
ncbi:DUF222 domain-containing protein [Kribbella sp. WER1]